MGNAIDSYGRGVALPDTATYAPDNVIFVESETLRLEVQNLFALATFIELEPGMDNAFSDGLEALIERYGDIALQEIENMALGEKVKPSIAMEALQYIGNTDSARWHNARRKMLERCLFKSRSAWIRDGAGLGLASLDNPRSIPVLKITIAQETCQALKLDLGLVLEQLQDTLRES